jgi:type II secretory ATPase GspE/PulE/Tfp pilus assembly ATPase PilB-like protein
MAEKLKIKREPSKIPEEKEEETLSTEFRKLSELYISINPEVKELQDQLISSGVGIFATTPEDTDHHTLEKLITAIDDNHDDKDESFNLEPYQSNALKNVGILPLWMNEDKGQNLVLALKSCEVDYFDKQGDKLTYNHNLINDNLVRRITGPIRNADEIIINYNDVMVPAIRQNFPNLKKINQETTQFIIVEPEIFTTLDEWITNPSKRRNFLNRISTETSARDSFYASIRKGISEDASDIHIEQYKEGGCRIRYRVDGVLREGSDHIKNPDALIAVIKTDANLKMDEKRRPQDGGIHFDKTTLRTRNIEKGYSLRVSITPTLYGEKAVMRLLQNKEESHLKELGYPPDIEQKIKEQIASPYGLVLVTGPTGSGKTTTLYAALREINKEGVNIATIEDPIEMPILGINQSQVNRAIGWDFDSALRTYLRQDPDIMLVGEIRDSETAKTAIEAAKTGHLVFSTLHTNDAISSLLRLYELGVANSDLQSSLQCVVAQRLVRKLCDKCKTQYNAKDEINEFLGAEVASEDIFLYRPPEEYKIPCLECSDTGYHGRIPLTELWIVSEREKQLIYDGCRDYQKYLTMAMEDGLVPLVVSGINSVLKSETTLDELGKHVPKSHFLNRRDNIIEAINQLYAHPE